MNKKVNLERIKILLQSSSLDDIKLGCLYLGKYTKKEIKNFLEKEGEREFQHECRNIPDYIPEHIPRKKGKMSFKIFSGYISFDEKTVYEGTGEDPHPDEFF